MSDNQQEIQRLKAVVYDALAQQQALNGVIAQTNQRIVELSQSADVDDNNDP